MAVYTTGPDEKVNKDALKDLQTVIPFSSPDMQKLEKAKNNEELNKLAIELSMKMYEEREKEFTSEIMRLMENDVYLQVLDTNWMQHLENMDHMRQGIGLRSIGQRDPLVEYRREGQRFFETMQDTVQNEVVKTLFRIIPRPQEAIEQAETELTQAAKRSVEGAKDATKQSKKSSSKAKKEAKTVRKAETPQPHKNKRNDARKKKKQQRKNKKKGRR